MSAGTALFRASRAPFPGLRSFSQDESELFFGREGQSDELARKLGQARFIAVVGTSGSGKSSLVRAGLLASLEGGCLVKVGSNWRIVDMRPGGRPIDNLAAALDAARLSETPVDPASLRGSSLALLDFARQAHEEKRLDADENLLILVDQFEEIFRYKSSESSMDDRDEKAAFVKLLLEVAKQRAFPVYVVITMRSDFLGDCAGFRDLPETINSGQYLIPRMTREQRREAIEGPIHMAGSAITPRLVQRILNDVGEDPDQLPVMQHALMRTWYRWRNQLDADRPVDTEDYEAIGTLDNALSSHADKAYAEASAKVPERGAQIVKRIFQRLRERDSSGRETRRPTPLRELCEISEATQEDMLAVLECFRREGRSFLMPPMTINLQGDREVDITHESLLRQWKRLQGPPSDDSGWLAEEEESRRNMVRLADRAEQQVEGNPDYLRGPLLQMALDWWDKRKPIEAWARRYTPSFVIAEAYLRKSEVNRKIEVEQEAEREKEAELARIEQASREQELKAKQVKVRAAFLLAGLSIVVALGAVLGILYVDKQNEKVRALQAHQHESEIQAAEEKRRADEGKQKAVDEALKRKEIEVEEAKRLEAEKDANDAKNARRKTSVQLLASRAAFTGTEGESQLALGMLLATESMRRQPLVDNEAVLSKGLPLLPTPLKPLPNSAAVETATFSSKGLLVTSELNKVSVWDPKSQILRHTFAITGESYAMVVSSDGNVLAVAYNENNKGVIGGFDLNTGKTIGRHFTEPGSRYFLSLANNGMLTIEVQDTQGDWTFHYWKDWSDEQSPTPQDSEKLIGLLANGAIAYSSDQSRVAMYDRSSGMFTVGAFPVPDPKTLRTWRALETVADIVFDPSDNNRLVSFDDNGTIKFWYVGYGVSALTISAGPTTSIQLSADGRLLATHRKDGVIRIWDSLDGTEVGRIFAGENDSGDIAIDALNGVVVLTKGNSTGKQQVPKLWRIAEVPLPKGITSADISTSAPLAILRAGTIAFPWNVTEARRGPNLDASTLKQVLGVSGDLKEVAGLCEKGKALCVANLENSKIGDSIQSSNDDPLQGAQPDQPLLFTRNKRFVAGSALKYNRLAGQVAGVFIWDTETRDIKPLWSESGAGAPGARPSDSSRPGAFLLGFTPDSDRCILLERPSNDSSKSVVKFWDLHSGNFSTEVPEPFRQPPAGFAFSRDGRWLAISSNLSPSAVATEQNYSVSIWQWPDAKQPFKTLDVGAKVNKMSFSSDDQYLLTAGDEPSIRVWDVSTGQEMSRVGLLRPVLAMSFVDNDQQIVAFDRYSATTSYWRAKDLIKEACERIGRSLSQAEWKKYLPDEPYFATCEAYLTDR
jgi:WD40 repeat protein